MKRAIRPVPIVVPQRDTPTDFKLTDSGVFEQGGVLVSKAGCIITRNCDAPSSQASSRPGSSCKEPGSAGSSRPCSRSSNTPGAAGSSTTAATAAAALAASSGCSSATAAPSSSTDPCAASTDTSTSGAAAPSSSKTTSSSSQAAIALDDLQELCVIGSGSSGVVKKVLHKPSGGVYVLKVINFDMGSEQVRRQVTTEVKALDGARHPHIVAYHQSYFANGAITILMEFMDGGSLWDVLQKVRVIPERYLPELARQVLLGLSHLHDTARICHRDIKPSNLLLNRSGALKISDFGVSSQLSSSMSKCLSWVGTVTYMSPERIRGDSYGFNTDVWSLGLLVLECAVGRYPYPPRPDGQAGGSGAEAPGAVGGARLGFWELLEYIVVEPAPKLPAGQFSPELVDFVGQCLQKDPAKRPSAADMLTHPFITNGRRSNLSHLLGPLGSSSSSRSSAAGSRCGAASSRAGIARSRSSGAAAAATGAGAGGAMSAGAGSSVGGSVGGVGVRAAGQQSSSASRSSVRGTSAGTSTAAAAAGPSSLRHSAAVAGQLAPYTSSYQLRPVSGGTVKVCAPGGTPQKQQQQQRQQQQRQLEPQEQQQARQRQQMQQPMPPRQQAQQVWQQQQQQQQRALLLQPQAGQVGQQQQRPLLVQQQAGQAGQQQQQARQHLAQQQVAQQRPLCQPSVQQQQRVQQLRQLPQQQQQVSHLHYQQHQHQQQQRQLVSLPAVSSGPLTALKPTPRRPPDVPA